MVEERNLLVLKLVTHSFEYVRLTLDKSPISKASSSLQTSPLPLSIDPGSREAIEGNLSLF